MAMMWTNGWTTGGWVLMGLMMLVFWSLVIGGIWWLVRYRRRGDTAEFSGPSSNQTSHEILDERFARGELTEEEYRRRSDLLRTR
jgi:putative membrane protein